LIVSEWFFVFAVIKSVMHVFGSSAGIGTFRLRKNIRHKIRNLAGCCEHLRSRCQKSWTLMVGGWPTGDLSFHWINSLPKAVTRQRSTQLGPSGGSTAWSLPYEE
jgi:hypothetical protein